MILPLHAREAVTLVAHEPAEEPEHDGHDDAGNVAMSIPCAEPW